MSIRVIAGSAKGRQLKLVPGDSTRPVMDRVKEALFSILGRTIYDSVFLDIFAGTGSIAIEALSRGGSHAIMLDIDRRAVQTINENLTLTKLTDKATVRRADAFVYLAGKPERAFDFIYIAPPQYQDLWLKALQLIDAQPGWLAPEGTIIVQIDPVENKPLALQAFITQDERKYGNTLLLFLAHRAAEDAAVALKE